MLDAYLDFIVSLEDVSDQQLQDFIDEREQFILLGSSDVMTKINTSIDTVFNKIDELAKQLKDEEIADESIQLAEDAAAVAAIWSFGLSMAASIALQIVDVALQAAIKSKEDDLYNHLNSADKDIADGVGDPCAKYISLVKSNNSYIVSLATGLASQKARSFLYNFMDYIASNVQGGVMLDNFKKYIEVAKRTKNDPNIDRINDILDKFALSGDHGEDEIKEALTGMQEALNDTSILHWIRGVFITICFGMKIGTAKITRAAKKAGVPPEEYSPQNFKAFDVMGKAMIAFSIMVSVADAI